MNESKVLRLCIMPPMRRYLAVCLFTCLAAPACKRQASAPVPSPPAKGVAKPAPKPSPATEQEVRSFLARWLAAQNEGKFDDYQALYAEKFQGVRRSGPRVRYLNRETWMGDRQRMFRKPMKVAVADLKIAIGASVTNVHFTQTWESGKYKDQGPKRIQLVSARSGWFIAQEEMLASQVAPRNAAGGDFLLVYAGAPVLATEVEESCGQGPRTLEDFVGHQDVRASRLPAHLQRWQGQKIEMFDQQGGVCTAKVTGFELTAQAEWHFATVQAWREEKLPEEEIAEEVWSQGGLLLLAKLSEERGSCKGPVLARAAGNESTPVVPFVQATGALLAETRKRAEQLLRRKGELGDAPKVMVAALPGAPKRALVFLSIDPETCTPEETLSAELIWSADLSGKHPVLTLLHQGESDFRDALLAADVDGDGEFEIIHSGWPRLKVGVMKLKDGGLESLLSVSIPFYDCPC
jgi:hypothetical protein